MNRRSILKSLASLALTPFVKLSGAASNAKLLLDRPKKFFQFVWATPQGKEFGKIFPSFKKALKNPPWKGAKHHKWKELQISGEEGFNFYEEATSVQEVAICSIPIYFDWKFHDEVFGSEAVKDVEWPGDFPKVLFGEDGVPINTPEWAKHTDKGYDRYSCNRFRDGFIRNLNMKEPPLTDQV